MKCLPRGTFDSWQRYSFAGISVGGQGPTWANIQPGNNVRYLRSAAVALDNKTVELLGLSVQEQDKWWQNKIALRDRILERVQLIENYFDIQKRGKSITAKQVKSSREFFFVTRAAALDPPLAREALNLIPKFHASVAIPKLPCEKMWELLLPKLLESRDEAESIIQLEEESKTDEIKAANEVQKYENLKESRRDNALPVQKAVLAIARKVVDHLKLSIQNESTAEADFVPLAFRRISEYFRASEAASINGPDTKLLLDDARMVYTCVIAPALNDLDIKPDLLKCPGCKRKDLRQLFDFDRLMAHIHKRHLNHIGSFGHFRVPKAYYPETEAYPWMSITWPKNLPILPRHQIATGVWDPDDDSDYQFETPVDRPDFSRSAFAGRTASEKYGLHPARLVDNIKFVLSKLKTVSLQPEFKTQIALRYATEMFTSIDAVVIGDTELKELQSALVREGYTDVFEEFMCQECHNDNELSRRNKRWAEKPQSLNRLSDHFKATHDIESWPTNMFNFPSDGELWLALIEPDHKEALSVFEDLYPLMS